MKRIIRWISLILIVALMAQILPMGVWANEQMHEATRVPEWNANEQEEQPYVIGEVRELRGENQKHFRMSDGSYIAVSYGDSVHFSDAEGTWQDIDNTLVASTNGREFQAVNGIERRRFASQIEEGGFLLSVESGEYGVQLSAVREDMENTLSTSQFGELTTEKQQPTAIVSNPQTSYATLAIEEKRELSLAEQTAPEKISSSVRYENVWEETDLEYSVMGQNVKECIVIHTAREVYSYSFLLRLTELTPLLNIDGSISLCNAQAEVVFSIPAPYMEDANGVLSSEAAYTLEDEGDGLYLLTVTADAQWMNAEERAFPVKLDPTIFKEGSAADKNIITSYVNSTNSNSTSYENTRYIRCGYYTNSYDTNCTGYTVGLIYIKELPELPKGSVPTQAYLNLFQTAYGGSTNSNHPKIYTSTLNTATSDDTIESYLNAITWNGFLSDINYGAPDANGERTALDYVKASMQTLYENYWDITSAVQTWYNEKGSANPSISKLLVLDDGHNTPSNSRATYAGYGYDASNALHLPQIIVEYRNTVGTEGIYDYHTQSVGRAGVGYVNNFTLGLSFQVPVASAPSEVLPFSLSLIYNSAHGETHFTATEDIHTKAYTTSQAGHGWKTSVQQSVVPVNITGNDSSTQKYLVYTDADGTEHYFAKKSGSSTVYEDEDGLGLTITASSSATNPTYYTMKDKNQNTWVFYYGYLTSFTDYNGNSLYYAYNGMDYSTTSTTWRPSNSTGTYQVTSVWRQNNEVENAEKLVELKYSQTVTDASGNKYAYLTGIVDHAGRTTTITVGYNLLQSITFPDGKTASYTYEAVENQKLLTSATDNEMLYRMEYTYSYWLGEMRIYTIREAAKEGATWITGDTMRAFKQNAVYTRFRYYGADRLPQTDEADEPLAKDDLVSRFWFDNWGRTVNVTTFNGDETEILNVSASNYTKNEGTDKKNNRLLGAASSGALSPNLLYNSGAEYETTGLDGWAVAGNGSSAAREDSGSDVLVKPRTGKYLMKLYQQNTGLGIHSRYQSVYLSAGTTYVFSAYVNTACATSFGTNGGAYLSVRNSIGEEQKTSRTINYKTNTAIDDGWERLELVYTPSSSGLYQFAANIKNMAEIAVFDDFQLEAIVNTVLGGQTDGAPSAANLLQLGSFEPPYTAGNTINSDKIQEWWTYEADKAVPVSYTGHGYAMTFAPGITAKHHATQVVPLNVPSNTTFLLSAWGLTPASVMNTEEDLTGVNSGNKRFFGIIATVTYTDGSPSKEYFYIPFNDDVSDWQYICGTIVPSQENKTVASITVDLACDYNANRAYMDDVRLVMEPVQTYAYDDDGNLLDTSDSENNKTSKEYDSSDRMISYTGMDGVSYALTYSGTNRDPATITSDGVTTDYTYDAAGNITQTKVTNTTDSRYLQSSATYSEDKDHVTQTTSVNGAVTRYSYYVEGNLSSNQKAIDLLKTATNAKGTVTEYTYNMYNDRSKTVEVGNNNVIAYQYERGRLAGLSRNDKNGTSGWTWQRYKTYYNAFGQSIKITVSQANDDMGFPYNTVGTELALAEYTYAPNGGNLQKMTYGNGDYVEYSYDLLDRVIEEVYYNSSGAEKHSVTFVYDARGQLAKRYTKIPSGTETDTVTETHIFEYDSLGRLIRSSEFDGANNLIQRIEQLYDKANRLEKQSWVIDGDSYSESYTYDTTDGMLSSAQTATGDTIEFSYDSLKRLNETNIKNSAGNTIYRTGYIYKAGTEANQTTAQIRGFTVWNPDYTNIVSTRYEYDALGNITRIEDGTGAARTLAEYTYDELNQLTQEKIYNYADNSANYTSIDTYVYTYDSAGNILTEKKNGTVVNAYTYSTGPWADQLVAVNGEEITYDGSGNPSIYVSGYGESYYMVGFDGRNWRGFQTLSDTRLQVAYDYDADGIRTAKCVDGEDHDYVTQNGKVVREIIEAGATEKVLDFVYDNSGKPFALTYTNGTATPVTYYYVLNIQGDVIALMTAERSIVAHYTYNAWGKVLSVTNDIGTAITSASHIANLNPIRYRGYYYDTETGFYYLQSRYYDPANHRFINADSYTSTGQGFLGFNMFAYCNNSPVTSYDPNGDILENVGSGIIIGGIIDYIINAIYYEFSDGESDLSSDSYTDEDSTVTRWDKIDYTKKNTGEAHYNVNAWRYYNEYTIHEYGWYCSGWAYEKEYPGASWLAASFRSAEVSPDEWDKRWYVNVATVLWGLLGL